MKTTALFIFLIFFSVIGHSQLMRSEVYDFSVGDYFGIEYRAGTWYGDEQHTKDYMYHILSKQISLNGDTVVYSAQRQIYLRPIPDGSGGNSPSSLTIDTFAFSYTRLNDSYHPLDNDHTFGNYLNVYWQIDTSNCDTSSIATSTTNICPNLISQEMEFKYSHMNNSEACAEGGKSYNSNYVVYSNAGGPYGGRNHPQPHPVFFYDNYSLFYVAHEGIECGSFPTSFLNIEEKNGLRLAVYPNPVANQLIIEGVESINSCFLTSSDGKLVNYMQLTKGNELDVSGLNSGVYFLHVTDISGKSGVVRFVK